MSKLYSKILIATDGSEQNRGAVLQAIDLAKSHQAVLHIVYVVDNVNFPSLPEDYPLDKIYTVLHKDGENAIRAVEGLAKKASLSFKGKILEGYPAIEIIKYAEDNDINVIVVGTLGRSGFKRFLIGSTAEKIINTAPCPVLVVRQTESLAQQTERLEK